MQQSLENRLRVRIEHLVELLSPESELLRSKKIRVKLSGDGTCISKRLHVVRFMLTILDESNKSGLFEDNHVLSMFKTPENYSSLKKALEDIIKDVERLERINIGDKLLDIKYQFLGRD